MAAVNNCAWHVLHDMSSFMSYVLKIESGSAGP